MEKAFIHGKLCVKRGALWYAYRKKPTRTDYWAQHNAVQGNWRNIAAQHLGDNHVIVNQK